MIVISTKDPRWLRTSGHWLQIDFQDCENSTLTLSSGVVVSELKIMAVITKEVVRWVNSSTERSICLSNEVFVKILDLYHFLALIQSKVLTILSSSVKNSKLNQFCSLYVHLVMGKVMWKGRKFHGRKSEDEKDLEGHWFGSVLQSSVVRRIAEQFSLFLCNFSFSSAPAAATATTASAGFSRFSQSELLS